MKLIYHLAQKDEWNQFSTSAEYSCSSLSDEGFIHCSEDEEQLLGVAHRLFAGETGLLALEVDTDLLTSPVKREPARSGVIYPHIYGPIDLNSVSGTRRILAGGDGSFILETK